MTAATGSEGQNSNGSKHVSWGRRLVQVSGLLINVVLVGVAGLWIMAAFEVVRVDFVGRGIYRHLPELQFAAVSGVLIVSLAGLVFGFMSEGRHKLARTAWWRASLLAAVLSGAAALYLRDVGDNVYYDIDEGLDDEAVWFFWIALSVVSLICSSIILCLSSLLAYLGKSKDGATAPAPSSAESRGGWLRYAGLTAVGAGAVAVLFMTVFQDEPGPSVSASVQPNALARTAGPFKRSFDANPPHYPWDAAAATTGASIIAQVKSPIDGKHPVLAGTTEISVVKLPWYDYARLIRLKDRRWSNPDLYIYYLATGTGDSPNMYRLNGTSPPIHEVNAKLKIQIGPDTALPYLRFFTFFVRGSEGPFYIIEDINDPILPRVEGTPRELISKAAKQAKLKGKSDDGQLLAEASVFYSNTVFDADFAVWPNGNIEMISDRPIAANLPAGVNAPLE